MVNSIKKTDITQEQIDFILNDIKSKGISIYGIPNKPVEGLNTEEWLKQAQSAISNSYAPNKLLSSQYITSITPFILNDFSEMSDIEKISFIQKQPSNTRTASLWMMQNDVKSAVTFEDFKNSLIKAANNPDFKAPTYQVFTQTGSVETVEDTYDLAKAKAWCSSVIRNAQTYSNYPSTPKHEPTQEKMVEKTKSFETTSKDPNERIEQWMEHVGMKDQAKDLINKYGLPVAYEIVQTSMQSPADVTIATDGKFRNSKDSIKYFLDNSVDVEKLATLPDLDIETVKASILSTRPEPIDKGPTIEMPSRVVSVPSDPKLSQFDAQKVQYAALMRDTLKLEGIDENEIKAAVDVAFKANLDNASVDMESWSGAFKYNLVKALGLEKITDDKDVYKNWGTALNEYSEKAIETSATGKTSEELKEQVATYSNEVNKKTLKGELASMSATETLNPETYFKDRQVQKQLLARAEKKAEKEAKKAEKTENRKERRDNMKEWFNNTFKSIAD